MKIGILGGSFDPIHNGHLYMAVKAKEFASLNEVWLMPAGHSPNKNETEMTSAQDRLAMCRLAASGLDGISVSSLEIESGECSYTYRTFQKLAKLYPDDEFYFILGADSLDYFEKWVHPEIIAQHARLLVINRDEFTVEELMRKAKEIQALFPAEIQIVPCEKYPAASSSIRARIANGSFGTEEFPQSFERLKTLELSSTSKFTKALELPEAVWDYIFNHKLYGTSKTINKNDMKETKMVFQEIRKKLKKELDKERYEHTKGVMYTAACLAMAHEADMERAMLAGLLHDCAKCVPNDEKIRLCEKNHMLISAAERENPPLLHAKAGAVLAETVYGVRDPEILHAIKVHTTGEPAMSLLDKIIFVADYIEPKRDRAANLDKIRHLAFYDLDRCVAEILYDTLIYLNGRRSTIDPSTQITFEYYKRFREG